MNAENPALNMNVGRSPARLRASLALMSLVIGKPELKGLDNLGKIPHDRELVIATTHLTYIDLPLAASALKDELDLAIAAMSVIHDVWKKPAEWACLKLAGTHNFFPIDFRVDKDGKQVARPFNPDNFDPLLSAMSHGKSVIIAAHSPSHDGKFTRAGIGAPYLAARSGATILPVAVNVANRGSENKLSTVLRRPDATIAIGEPMSMSAGPDVSEMSALFNRRRQGEILAHNDVNEFGQISSYLREQGEIIVGSLVELSETIA
jgi:1-acyl-sn-glycerol-3-phosphate acyltransferase